MIFRRPLTGEQHPRAKLLNRQRGTIQRRIDNGEPQRRLAREFQVSQMTVFRIYWGPDYRDEG